MRTPGAFTTNAAGERVIKAGQIKFQATPLEQVLDVYAELIGRTILRPASLPAAQITLKTQSELTMQQAKEALDSVLSLNGISTLMVGDKFVTIVPTAQIQQEGGVINRDTNAVNNLPEAGQYTTKVVTLKFARTTDVMPAIQPFAKVQNGILAIEQNGILILRDYAANIKRMLEIIEQIDVEVPLNERLEVIPIRFALASDIASVLGSLTSGGVTTSGTAGRTPATRGRNPRTGMGGATGPGATPGFGTPGVGGANYPGVNTVTTPGGINTPLGGNTGASPSNFADRLRQSIQNAVRPGGGAGPASPLLGEAKILADERTNSLLVFGTEDDIKSVKKVVEQIDLIQAQVLIEAIIMEVSLDDTKNVGVSAAQTQKRFGRGVAGFGGNNNGNFFSSTNGSVISPSSLPGGFSYFTSIGNNWQLALTAIATDGSVNVLSRPRIQTFHATEASLFVGDTVPYVTGTISDINGGNRSQYQQTQVGITLNVLPLINPDGLVVMDIQQNIEQLGTPTQIDGNNVPTTTKRQASAKVAVQDGETIILGGFISSTKSSSKSGIPYLKDIPGLGALFRSKIDGNKRVELIVLMRPTVLRTPEAASITAAQERERLAGVKRAEMQLLEDEHNLSEKNKEIMRRMEREKLKDLEKDKGEKERAMKKSKLPEPPPTRQPLNSERPEEPKLEPDKTSAP
jgi:general secretion pathway protein D